MAHGIQVYGFSDLKEEGEKKIIQSHSFNCFKLFSLHLCGSKMTTSGDTACKAIVCFLGM